MNRCKRHYSIMMTVILCVIFIAFGTTIASAGTSNSKLENYNYPTKIVAGNIFSVKGTIKSNNKIKRVEIGIVNAGTNKWTQYKYDNKKVNSNSFNIKQADKKLLFGKLATGEYYYRIYIHDANGVKTVLNKKFKVVKNTTYISNLSIPKKLTEGTSCTVKGKIQSKYKIKRVEIGVVSSSGKWTKQKYDNKKVSSKTFDISKSKNKVKFQKLSPGTYYYRIYAHLSNGKVVTLSDKQFVIAKKPEEQSKVTYKDYTATATNENVANESEGADQEPKTATMKKGIVVPNYKDGSKYKISGIITANGTITRVEIGIVSDDTGKWVDGQKYDNKNVNSSKFDVSVAASSLHFEKLSTGKYYYRIYVHFDDGSLAILNNQSFNVVPGTSNKKAIDAAVSWAVRIANDDSFTYGTGSRAHRYGCYFCGTNTGPKLKMKEKKGEPHVVDGHTYEKTYCCNPFIHAAYAHGAGDATMLAACQKGQGVGTAAWTFTRYGNWVNVGKPNYNSLKKGDVLVVSYKKGGGHVAMYIGNGQLVEAAGGGWSASSIRVANLSQTRYKNFGFVMRYTGTGKF